MTTISYDFYTLDSASETRRHHEHLERLSYREYVYSVSVYRKYLTYLEN